MHSSLPRPFLHTLAGLLLLFFLANTKECSSGEHIMDEESEFCAPNYDHCLIYEVEKLSCKECIEEFFLKKDKTNMGYCVSLDHVHSQSHSEQDSDFMKIIILILLIVLIGMVIIVLARQLLFNKTKVKKVLEGPISHPDPANQSSNMNDSVNHGNCSMDPVFNHPETVTPTWGRQDSRQEIDESHWWEFKPLRGTLSKWKTLTKNR
jgi:hypothetical protein